MKDHLVRNKGGLYWERYGAQWVPVVAIAEFMTEETATDIVRRYPEHEIVKIVDVGSRQELQSLIDHLEGAKALFDDQSS